MAIQLALARGLDHHRGGRLDEAVSSYDAVLQAAPGQVAALVNKGVALRQLRRAGEAMVQYWRALAMEPGTADIWCNAGNALLDLDRDDEALEALKAARVRAPALPEVWSGLARALTRRGQTAAAEACLRRAIGLNGGPGAPHLNLGRLLVDAGRWEEALDALRQAGTEAAVLTAHAEALIALGRLDEAERALTAPLDAGYAPARPVWANLLHIRGDHAGAWAAWTGQRHRRIAALTTPEWNGGILSGKTILVYTEADVADALMLARCLPLLAAQGATVSVICQQRLVRLFSRIEGVAAVAASWKPLPAHDVWCCLNALPRHLRLTAVPDRLPLSGSTPRTLPRPLGTRLTLGVGARDEAGLDALLPVTGIDGVAAYTLKVGGDTPHPALIGPVTPAPRDVADQADWIAALDGVVTDDPMLGQLALCLGKPLWLVGGSDWRFPRVVDSIEPVVAEVRALVHARPRAEAERTDIAFTAIFADDSGAPRFCMSAPRAFLGDPGVRYLVAREVRGVGYEYATRSFIDAHLEPGDLFIDVGAHWGIMALQAATRWPGQIQVLAIEPAERNRQHLRRWIADNGLETCVEVVAAAAADGPGQGWLKPESTMGHSLIRRDDGPVAVTAIDALLADRPALQGRRTIVKIDVEGGEPAVIAGMRSLLEGGRVAAVIWERGIEYDTPSGHARLAALRARFDALGFAAWRFESEDRAGRLVPFVEDGRNGNVFELPTATLPRAAYGVPRPAPRSNPDAGLEAAVRARELFRRSLGLAEKDSLAVLAQAVRLDGGVSECWNNLGVGLRNQGKRAAAVACYRRARSLDRTQGDILSNLGNALREQGELTEARACHTQAMVAKPGNASFLYNAALTLRDGGEAARAATMFARAQRVDPGNPEYAWNTALGLLAAKDYRAGFQAYESRWGLPRAKRRKVALPVWDGAPLAGESVFLHDEQGFGDVVQFARFIPRVKQRGAGRVVVECQPELMRLMALAPGVDAVVPRETGVPACDRTAPLLSLPALLGLDFGDLPAAPIPYLKAPPPMFDLPRDGRLRLGLVWAGKPAPRDRSIPLPLLLPLLGDPRLAPFSLQVGPRAGDLRRSGADAFIADLGPHLIDFAATASVLAQLDLLVTVDTAVAHVAGALGLPTFVLLKSVSDWRWLDRGSDSPWYPSVTLFRQHRADCWTAALAEVQGALSRFADQRLTGLCSPERDETR